MSKNYSNLVYAIVINAIRDYKSACKAYEKHKDDLIQHDDLLKKKMIIRQEILSPWFAFLMNVNFEEILEQVESEVRTNERTRSRYMSNKAKR